MRSTIAAVRIGLVGPCIGACLVLAGCSRPPLTWNITPDEAYARLEKADVAGFRLARQCGAMIYLDPEKKPGQSIRWTVTAGGQVMASFTVRLLPEGKGTRAVIDIPRDPRGGEIYDGEKFYTRPAVNQPLRPAVEELVNSAMEGRHFSGDDLASTDGVCTSQRGEMESGAFRFTVDGDDGKDAKDSHGRDGHGSAEDTGQAEHKAPAFGEPTDPN